MPNDNNNTSTPSKMPEPTMSDIFQLLKCVASKEDILDIKSQITASNTETTEKIESINRRISIAEEVNADQASKLEMLEANIEILKQDQLKNNICISGVPPEKFSNDNKTNEIVISIAKALGAEFTHTQFSSYAVAKNKFVIVHFYNLKHKQILLNKIRIRKSLMVEEVFGIKSNSQIYLNDHLTPYFNNLYLIARRAKKEGKLASASSYGGKIRARKSTNDAPSVIVCEKQLQLLIDDNGDSSNNSIMYVSNSSIADTSSPTRVSSRDNQHPNSHKPKIRNHRQTNNANKSSNKNTNSNNTQKNNGPRKRTNPTRTAGKRKLDDNSEEEKKPKKQKEQQQITNSK